MFGFSFWEVSLVLVVALVVIGPERLPGVARKAGEWTYKVRKFVSNAKAEMDSEFNMQDMKQLLNSQESEISKLRAMVEETRDDLSDSGKSVKGALSDAEQTMRDSAAGEKARQDSARRLAALDESGRAPGEEDDFEDELNRLESETGETFRRPFESADADAPAEPATTQESTAKDQDEPTERGRDN